MGLLSVLGLITERIGFVGVFMLYFSLNTVIWYAFDLCIEHYSRESNTGNIRGLYLNINNFGWVLAPMLASAVALKLGFTGTYLLASGAVLVALIIIVCTTRIKHSTHTPKLHLHQAFAELVTHSEARRLVSLYFVLQFFFALMVIYMVPYLTALGFDLKSIGIILSIMLLPFVMLQYAVGKMADRHRNEKALIVLGFCIMGLATLLLALPDSFIFGPTLGFFAAVLFLTRVGASIIEVAVESKFFKVVTEKDTALISTLRMTLPLAYIIAPLVGALILVGGSMQSLFAILGFICLGAMMYALRLKQR
jgi:predicted MFS family arabinose efflux permease